MKLRMWAKNNAEKIIIAGIFGLLPLVFCSIYCAVYQKGLGDIYLPASYWNDELFYYKQVEGILEHGVPGGYFGYNESHGRYLSFATWNPLLLYIWVIWGLIFGWGIMSPVICNLVVISLCMIAFAWMAKPGRRQATAIAVLLGLYTPFSRYMMSVSLEVICCSFVLLYMGALLGYAREKKEHYLWIMFFVSVVLTLVRPYFLLFILYPAFLYGKQGGRKWIVALAMPVLAFGGYVWFKYLFSADYLQNTVGGTFLEVFIEQGFIAGVQNLCKIGFEGFALVIDFMKKAIRYGHFAGCMYAVSGVLGVIVLVVGIMEWKRRREKKTSYQMLSMALAMVAMMFAILYLYKIHEGSRHLLTFILAGILLLGMYERKRAIALQAVLAVTISFFFIVKAGTPYDYLVPFDDGIVSEEVDALNEGLEEKMELKSGIGWDNTVIWLASDIVNGENTFAAWQQLYALPGGFGINYCAQTYVYDNLENINSRYIAAIPGGDVEKQLKEEGAVLLESNDKVAIYDRRPNARD